MSYSYDKFLRPITTSDKSIKILDDTNDIKYTIDPFVITNAAAINNILRISLRSLKVILLSFSSKNEAKIALTRLQQQIDTLTTKVPILIDKDIQNYIQYQIEQIGIIVGPTGPQGSTGSIGPQGVTGSIGPQGATGSADRYAATSSTTFETPIVGEVIDLVTQTDLAYSTAQNVVIYSDLPNLYNSDYETDGSYFIGQIDYYDTQTGDMSLVTTFSSGSGTYSFWYLNLSGMTSDSTSLDLTSLTTDIIPAVDSLYSLGTSASQWKSLHVSGQTIYIGGLPLSTDGESLVVSSINLGTTASPLILSANNDVLLLNGTGSVGATGADGLQGPIGPTGADGLQGPIGPTGSFNPSYNVFTALITQSGGTNELDLTFDGQEPAPITEVGVTYEIVQVGDDIDFTLIGAPDNNVGTKFIATGTFPGFGTSPSSILSYDTGTPVAIVLENTIGNIWFAYLESGAYNVVSDNLFVDNKTFINVTHFPAIDDVRIRFSFRKTGSPGSINLATVKASEVPENDLLLNTPIEIRVYN